MNFTVTVEFVSRKNPKDDFQTKLFYTIDKIRAIRDKHQDSPYPSLPRKNEIIYVFIQVKKNTHQ